MYQRPCPCRIFSLSYACTIHTRTPLYFFIFLNSLWIHLNFPGLLCETRPLSERHTQTKIALGCPLGQVLSAPWDPEGSTSTTPPALLHLRYPPRGRYWGSYIFFNVFRWSCHFRAKSRNCLKLDSEPTRSRLSTDTLFRPKVPYAYHCTEGTLIVHGVRFKSRLHRSNSTMTWINGTNCTTFPCSYLPYGVRT